MNIFGMYYPMFIWRFSYYKFLENRISHLCFTSLHLLTNFLLESTNLIWMLVSSCLCWHWILSIFLIFHRLTKTWKIIVLCMCFWMPLMLTCCHMFNSFLHFPLELFVHVLCQFVIRMFVLSYWFWNFCVY